MSKELKLIFSVAKYLPKISPMRPRPITAAFSFFFILEILKALIDILDKKQKISFFYLKIYF